MEELEADWPSGLVTITSAAPSEPAGVTHDSDVDELTVTAVQLCPPMVTVTMPEVANPVPVRVTASPPVGGRAAGDAPVSVGGAT